MMEYLEATEVATKQILAELDEQIQLARMGAFEEGAAQMEEQARIARCSCSSGPVPVPNDHGLLCPIAVWTRAAKLLRTLKAAEEAKSDRFDNDAEGVAV